jgi:hypothetical protein
MGTGRRALAAFVIITATCVVTVATVGGLIGVSPREGWWWDQVWLAQAQVAFNIVGAGLAAGAVLYAWRVATKQFEMMREQETVINRQLSMLEEQRDISRRMEGIENEQRELLKSQAQMAERQGQMIERQGQIAEEQQKLVREQLAKKVELDLRLEWREPEPGTSPGHTAYDVHVKNHGARTCVHFYLALLIPRDRMTEIGMETNMARVGKQKVEEAWYEQFSKSIDTRIYPTRATNPIDHLS